MPGSAGVPAAAVADTSVVPYNVVPTLDETVACVIVEPVAANMGLVAPVDGFLEGLRAECDRVGALLIFDEVITGFRVARGGAQERFGVTPDLTCFGKVIGGGLNVGAFGGRAEVMDRLAPDGPVYQAGTLSGNPLATAAGLAALSLLDDDAYGTLQERGRVARIRTCRTRSPGGGLTARCTVVGSLVGLYFGDHDRSTTRTPVAPMRRPTPRSSTPCSTAAWRWLPGRTRSCSPVSPTTTRSSPRSSTSRRRGAAGCGDRACRIGAGAAGTIPTTAPASGSNGAQARNAEVSMADDVFAGERLGPLAGDVTRVLDTLGADDAVARIWSRDHTLWAPDPTEIADRLGWLQVAGEVLAERARLDGFVEQARGRRADPRGGDGHGRVEPVPRGPGPHVPAAQATAGAHRARHDRPAAIARIEATSPLDADAVHRLVQVRDRPSRRAATSPTSGRGSAGPSSSRSSPTPARSSATLARERGFREIFENRPDIGGRYSALSLLRPRARLRCPASTGQAWSRPRSTSSRRSDDVRRREPRPAARRDLRCRGARPGRDKLTLVIDGRVATFGLWLEQLLAESTGKHGTGVVPVAGEPLGPPDVYGDDRLFVVIGEPPSAVGLDVLADAGHPVVELGARRSAADRPAGPAVGVRHRGVRRGARHQRVRPAQRGRGEGGHQEGAGRAGHPTSRSHRSTTCWPRSPRATTSRSRPTSTPEIRSSTQLQEARIAAPRRAPRRHDVRPRARATCTPPASCTRAARRPACSCRSSDADPTDAPIPGEPFTFAELEHAQADGDFLTLRDHGLRVARVTIDDLENR